MTNRFRIINGVGIYDELTGKTYNKWSDLCDLLNKVNNRADKNAEIIWDTLDEIDDKEIVSDLLVHFFMKV